MKNLIFTILLLSCFIMACQKENIKLQETTEHLSTSIQTSADDACGILDQLDLTSLREEDGILHFKDVNHFFGTMDQLADAISYYDNDNIDFLLIATCFSTQFTDFKPYTDPVNSLPIYHQILLSEYGEVIIDGIYNIIMPNGESIQKANISKQEIEEMRKEVEIEERAGEGDCHFHRFTNSVRLFNYCGEAFVMQSELRIINVNNIHAVEGLVKCHKAGNPQALVDVTELAVELNGKLSIGCGIVFDLQVPNVYNTNLQGGAVPYKDHCHNCSLELVRVTFSKAVTLREGAEFLKGNYRLKMDHCANTHEEDMSLLIVND